jgi:iron(II)-dependent oxidoreductase
VSYASLLNELRRARELVTARVDTLTDTDSRTQYHPDLSPPGWHLGHCAFTESAWLQATICNDDRCTRPFAALYTPTETPRHERGAKLPALATLLAWCNGLQSVNDDLLEAQSPQLMNHPLMQDNYLLHFLIQHYSQHYESIQMVLTQRAIQSDTGDYKVDDPLVAQKPAHERVAVEPGHYRVGGRAPIAYDNELPPQQATLGPFSIASRALSNSEFLAFMQTGGYQRKEFWSEPGWRWQQQQAVEHPDHWRKNTFGNWYGIAARGAYTLAGSEPVAGISFHEAEACANWAGGRLPHEHQWEVACRLQLLEDSGRAWEWCGNTFHPYEGYRSFPYENYSKPWFDDGHYSLRGGSLHTRPSIKRASFRNFYEPDKRHIFAGLRLAYDTHV